VCVVAQGRRRRDSIKLEKHTLRYRFDGAGGGVLQRPRIEARNGPGYDSVFFSYEVNRQGGASAIGRNCLRPRPPNPKRWCCGISYGYRRNSHHRDLRDLQCCIPAARSPPTHAGRLSTAAFTKAKIGPAEDATLATSVRRCFTRFIREWVRARGAVSLSEGIRKCRESRRRFGASTPAMRAKGRRSRARMQTCGVRFRHAHRPGAFRR